MTERECYTEDEYFEFERAIFGRWEYVKGEIRAVSDGTADHSTIGGNILATLRVALLPRGCRAPGSDMKVHTRAQVNTFPDVSVVCGQVGFHRGRKDIITNPLLVAQDEAHIQLYTRREDHWEFRDISGLDSTVRLPSVETTLALSDVHALIEFAPDEEGT